MTRTEQQRRLTLIIATLNQIDDYCRHGHTPSGWAQVIDALLDYETVTTPRRPAARARMRLGRPRPSGVATDGADVNERVTGGATAPHRRPTTDDRLPA